MVETRRISTLIETQLPEFISTDYENFSKVVEKYYEQLELTGQPLDVIQNIGKYRDIDFYEKNLLKESTTLSSNISASDSTILVADATSFPESNGYISIGDEILFYKERTDTSFLEVSRGVSGNQSLGDLYTSSNFVTTLSTEHLSGDNVQNISNLFLYAFVKNFESDYLASFPEKYLKGSVDKRTLIKNITDFYQAKGTDRSIKFIFNTLVSNDKPEVLKPKDNTLKASFSDWITSYSLKVKILSGNPESLIGEQLTQALDPLDSSIGFASGIIDNIFSIGDGLHEVVIDTSTLNNEFDIAAKTTLTENLNLGTTIDDRVNVFSTEGFNTRGRFLIGSEVFEYNQKNVDQFVISRREGNSSYTSGTDVYSVSTVTSKNAEILVLGVLYNLDTEIEAPYSEEGDTIQISDPGFITRDPIINDIATNQTRWILSTSKASSLNPTITGQINDLNADVSAVYEDGNYYYICSSGYPGRSILTATTDQTLSDQKLMRLIRKKPLTITETYATPQRDVGIFVDGSVAFSQKDFRQVKFGPINTFNVINKGGAYKGAPYVLVNNKPGFARALMSGETIDSVESLSNTSYTSVPEVTITSGRGATGTAKVTFGKITSIKVTNAGEYYSTPPLVVITDRLGKGRFAEYNAILKDGKIVEFESVDQGKFYSKGNVIVQIIPVGSRGEVTCDIVTWTRNRYDVLSTEIDASNGYVFQNYNPTRGYGYGIIANPTELRTQLNDDGTNHSPILGFAYDGNPIYGPYGYRNPLDSTSAISRLNSSYQLKSSRVGGPILADYPLGSFIEDYEWIPGTETGKLNLDENNGRYCATPEYPRGTYAYFITIDANGIPAYPYILGQNFYSLPVDSNYNADLTQDDLPAKAKRLRTSSIESNGSESILKVNKTIAGSVNNLNIEDSPATFKVGNRFIIEDSDTEGSGASAIIASVEGKTITSIDSKSLDPTNQYSVALIKLISPTFLFENDVITQTGSDFTGRVIGDVFNRNEFVIELVTGTYTEGAKLNSSSNIINIITDRNAFYSKNSTLLLTDGEDSVLATGRILETTANQNSIKVEVLTGEFIVPESERVSYFLQSTTIGDTVGAEVVVYSELSKGLVPFSVKTDVALLKTDEPHNVGVGTYVDIDIIPDVAQTSTEYYVRKRFYQEITLKAPSYNSILKDTGIGRGDLLNGGLDYTSGEYLDLELIFSDQSKVRNGIGAVGDADNARATINVSDFNGSGYGSVSDFTITSKGTNYIKGDILTVSDADLSRLSNSISTQRLAINVDHVGFSQLNTRISLVQVNKLSVNDLLLIDSEIVKVLTIDSGNNSVIVERGFENTIVVDHFNNAAVTLYSGQYRFNDNSRPLGTGPNDPYIINYDSTTQRVILAHNYGSTSPREVTLSTIFQDDSSPRKSISISTATPGENRLEFSKDASFATYGVNTDIRIQKYYRYVFDTSHFSMLGIFLDFSASKTGSIFTEEKEVSGIQPGNNGSFVAITLGFGPSITGFAQQRFPVNFDTYYYFIKANSDVNTESAALKVIDDPLTGSKEVLFATSNKFVYQYTEDPDYNGLGTLSYTTSSPAAEGKINTASIDNKGSNYKRVPIVKGCIVTENNEPTLEIQWDALTRSILSVNVVDGGNGYVNPQAIVTTGDGSGAEFKVFSDNGVIKRIDVINPGKGYTFEPIISVYESNIVAYFDSKTIGIPQDISIVKSGSSFHRDNTLLSEYTSNYALIIKGSSKFFKGEVVEQRDGNTLIFSGYIADKGYRIGSNILRLEKVSGVVDTSIPLVSGIDSSRSVEVVSLLTSTFVPNIESYSDNIGKFTSGRGKVGDRYQKITDSFYYQDYSYVIKSKTSINVWRDLINQTTHPAGFKLFGEVLIETNQESTMPTEQPFSPRISFIELSPKVITTESTRTRRVVTQTSVRAVDTNLRRGLGSVSVNEYDTEGILSKQLILQQDFNGRYATEEDYIGPLDSIQTAVGNTTFFKDSATAASSFVLGANQSAKLYEVKMVRNNQNIPISQWQDSDIAFSLINQSTDFDIISGSGQIEVGASNAFRLGWFYNIGAGESGIVGVEGNVATRKFCLMLIGNNVGEDAEELTSNFKVGDQVKLYENATTHYTIEILRVDAPAYDSVFGVIGDGNVLGRRSFQILDKANNLAYTPYNDQELFITLNGVAQEPGKAFQVSDSKIVFSSPPLGAQYPITGENFDDTYVTDPTTFLCKSFKFKQDSYNSKYLKKLKDISDNFDGITTEFALQWEDGTIVKTEPKENLLVFINGVLQAVNTAYTIRRSETASNADIIVFSEPPRNFYDVIDYTPEQLDQKEYFYAYGVGSYDRLKIDERLIPYRGTGPYLLFDEETDIVKNINDSEFVLVFVDGVLQNPNSYILNGPNISFTGTLKKFNPSTGESLASKVEMISLFGRQVPKTLSAYDYDRIIFRNLININITRTLNTAAGNTEYLQWQENFTSLEPSSDKIVFTFDEDGNRIIVGKLNSVRFNTLADGSSTGLAKPGIVATDLSIEVLNAANLVFTTNTFTAGLGEDDGELKLKSIYISDQSDFSNPVSFNVNNEVFSIQWSYKTDEDGERVLSKDLPAWLNGSDLGEKAYYEMYDVLVDILPGDQIMVDGESAYRDIISLPNEVKGRNFNRGETAKYDHFSNIEVSNYNGIVRGEGLSVTSQITNGVVTSVGFSDLEWNRRDLKLFFDTGILLQPTAYQYFVPPQVKFIPVDGNGGGARAEVLTIAGQVLDVILIEGGSGYTQPPKAVVTRGYNVLRKRDRVISSTYEINIGTQISGGANINGQSEITLIGDGVTSGLLSILTFGVVGSVTPVDGDEIVVHIQPDSENSGDNLEVVESALIVKREAFEAVDQLASELIINETLITVSIDNPIASITNISPTGPNGNTSLVDGFDLYIQKVINTPIAYVREQSSSATGAFLDSPLSQSATTVYVTNTSLFADVGKLQIGKEIVTYERKLEDRFFDVTRGVAGTTATPHPAGQYIRTIPDSVRVIQSGPRTIVSTIVSVAQEPEVVSVATSQIQVITDVVDVDVTTLNKVTLQKEINPGVTVVSTAVQDYVISITESSVLMSDVVAFEVGAIVIEKLITSTIVTEKLSDELTQSISSSVQQSLLIQPELPSPLGGASASPVQVQTLLANESAITNRVRGLTSIGSINPVLPKPADVTLNRQTGVLDFFEELVVLDTTIVTRN